MMASEGDLTSDQMDILVQFQDLTGIEDFDRCRTLMDSHNWNLESAVQDCFSEPPPPPPPPLLNAVTIERTPAVNISPPEQRILTVAQRNIGWVNWSYALFSFPFRLIYSSLFGILEYLYHLLRRDTAAIARHPEADVLQFIESFEDMYGQQHPTFFRGSYNQALIQAKRDLKFLLVYLHCEDHRDVHMFCRTTLCSEEFTNFVNNNMMFWACSVSLAEGSRVSQSLRDSTYPFMALIVLKENKMNVVARVEGPHESTRLISELSNLMESNMSGLVATRRDREERHFNMTLRQQQDEAYQMSLTADREKERRKREEEEEKERRRRAEDEEMRAQQEREERDRLELERMREEIRNQIPNEPDPSDPDTIRVLLKLPNGSRLERRFDRNQSVQQLHNFVFVHELAPDDFEIIKSHPRTSIPCNKRKFQLQSSSEASSLHSTSDSNDLDDVPTFAQLGFEKCELLHVHDNEA